MKIIDGHCHLDRALTFADRYFEHEGGLSAFVDAPLTQKQTITGVLHRGPAYTEASLRKRMSAVIKSKIKAGEAVLNAVIDCSPDLDGRAFAVGLELQEKYADRIQINLGAYPIFGFETWESDRLLHFREMARQAQFVVGLPERDNRAENPVGFNGHLAILIETALEFGLGLQVHVDQTNTPDEDGTERLINMVECLVKSRNLTLPEIWAVHMISPSCYDEDRFNRLLERMRLNNVGLIVCPHAAISMRQMRTASAPIHNSIARVREALVAGVRVMLGTDNLNDLFMPLPKSRLLKREFNTLASALRYYDRSVINKLACGDKLNETDKESLMRSLRGDREAFGLA